MLFHHLFNNLAIIAAAAPSWAHTHADPMIHTDDDECIFTRYTREQERAAFYRTLKQHEPLPDPISRQLHNHTRLQREGKLCSAIQICLCAGTIAGGHLKQTFARLVSLVQHGVIVCLLPTACRDRVEKSFVFLSSFL